MVTCTFCLDEIDVTHLENEEVIQPCKCRGSMGYVHLKCLTTAISSPYRFRKCGVCNEPYDIEAPPSSNSSQDGNEQAPLLPQHRLPLTNSEALDIIRQRIRQDRLPTHAQNSQESRERTHFCRLTIRLFTVLAVLAMIYMTFSTVDAFDIIRNQVKSNCSYVNNTLYTSKGHGGNIYLAEGVVVVNDLSESYDMGTMVYVHSGDHNIPTFTLDSLKSKKNLYTYAYDSEKDFYYTFYSYEKISECYVDPVDFTSLTLCNSFNECYPSKWDTPTYVNTSIILTIILWVILCCCVRITCAYKRRPNDE